MKQLILAGAMLPALLSPAVAQTVNDPTQQPPAPFPGGTVTLSPPQSVYNCATLEDLRDIVEAETEAATAWQFSAKEAPQKNGVPLCRYLIDTERQQIALVAQLDGLVPVLQYPPVADGIGGQLTVVLYRGYDGREIPYYVALGHPFVGGESANIVFDFIAAIKP